MTCTETREVLSPYLDGELSPSEAAEVGVHLDACAACREELGALRLTSRLTASLPSTRLTTDLASTVVGRASRSVWRERLDSIRNLIAPPGQLLVREYGRAVAALALIMLAVVGRGQGAGDFVISWPGRVAGAAGTAVGAITAGLAEAQVMLETQSLPAVPKPAASQTEQRRPKPIRPSSIPSSTAITLNIEEAHSHVRV
jgi:anti-sigma factor RsiW